MRLADALDHQAHVLAGDGGETLDPQDVVLRAVSAQALQQALAGASTSPSSTRKLVKSSWSCSPPSSWCDGRESRSSSAAAPSPSSTGGVDGAVARPARSVFTAGRSSAADLVVEPRRAALVQQVGLVEHHHVGAAELLLEELLQRAVVVERLVGRGAGPRPLPDRRQRDPSATAGPSITVITPSTVTRVRISGQLKALTSGFGSARPEVSMTMWSGGSARSSSASMVGRKSSATVQQMQPLASLRLNRALEAQKSQQTAKNKAPAGNRIIKDNSFNPSIGLVLNSQSLLVHAKNRRRYGWLRHW